MTHGDTWPMACLHTFVCLSLLFAYVYVRIQMVLSVSQVSCVVRFVGLLICVCALCFIITYVVMISVPCCSEIVPRCSQARSRQRCTDIPCCIVFLAAIAAFGMVYIKALATGNIARLYHGANWQGEVCGVDPAVVDKPMLYWCMKSQFGGIPEAWEKGGGGQLLDFLKEVILGGRQSVSRPLTSVSPRLPVAAPNFVCICARSAHVGARFQTTLLALDRALPGGPLVDFSMCPLELTPKSCPTRGWGAVPDAGPGRPAGDLLSRLRHFKVCRWN